MSTPTQETNQVKRIESPENPTYKSWLKLLKSPGIKKQNQFILSGSKLVKEALQHHPQLFAAQITEEGQNHLPPSSELPHYCLPSRLFKDLDTLGTKSALLLGHLPPIKAWTPATSKEPELLLALSDPGNLGSALRAACAFDIQNIVLLDEASHPFLPKALKAASGATFSLNLMKGPSIRELTDILPEHPQHNWVGLDLRGQALHHYTWPKNFSLILGEEGLGLGNLALQKIHIPTSPKIESLNAVQSLSIALHNQKVQGT